MNVLITGATGRMGQALAPLLHSFQLLTPNRNELNILDKGSIETYLDTHSIDVILHLAAYTNVARAEHEQELCYHTNVTAVRHLVKLSDVRHFVHLSTDYVFDGEKGMYTEDEPVNPKNHYSLSKALGEEAARGHRHPLVVRTSFKTSPWPYPKAFVDQYTSADYVDTIAQELVKLMIHLDTVRDFDVLHIGTERKSVFELAKRRSPDILPMHRHDAPVYIPPDVSLNTDRWISLKKEWTLVDSDGTPTSPKVEGHEKRQKV